MKIIVTSNQHPNEVCAVEVWKQLKREYEGSQDIKFYKFPDDAYVESLKFFSEAAISDGIINQRLAHLDGDARAKANLFIAGLSNCSFEDILYCNRSFYRLDQNVLHSILQSLPEAGVIKGRFPGNYYERDANLCRENSVDAVLDLHNFWINGFCSQNTPWPASTSIQMDGFPKEPRFQQICESLYSMYPPDVGMIRQLTCSGTGFFIELPAVYVETGLANNKLALSLFGNDLFNYYLRGRSDANLSENQKIIPKHVAQVKDIIEALLEYEL